MVRVDASPMLGSSDDMFCLACDATRLGEGNAICVHDCVSAARSRLFTAFLLTSATKKRSKRNTRPTRGSEWPQAAAGWRRAGRVGLSGYSFGTLVGRAVETAVLGRPFLGVGISWYR